MSKKEKQSPLENGLGLETILPLAMAKAQTDNADQQASGKAQSGAQKDEKTADTAKAEAKSDVSKNAPKTEQTVEETLKKLEDRIKHTRDEFTKEREARVTMERKLQAAQNELTVANQKLAGTYVEPSLEDREKAALEGLKTRVDLSTELAIEKFGQERVTADVLAQDSVYRQLENSYPEIGARVAAARFPVVEAIKVVEEYKFFDKYGRDPNAIREKIAAEEREKVLAELKADAKTKDSRTHDDVHGVSTVGGTGEKAHSRNAMESTGINPSVLFPNFRNNV